MMCGYWFGGLTWLVMPAVMLLVLVLAVVLVWALVPWLNRKPTLPAPHDSYPMANEPSALEVLQQRYARRKPSRTCGNGLWRLVRMTTTARARVASLPGIVVLVSIVRSLVVPLTTVL
jgi:hypothetical protein